MVYLVYVAVSGEEKISIFTMDPGAGKLSFREDVALGAGPGPLAVDPRQQFLFAGLRSTREITSLRIAPGTGALSPIGRVSLESDPCFLSTDRAGRFLLSAYYRAGVAAVHSIGADGALGAKPIEWISTAEHAHSIQTDPTNRFAFVPHVAPPNRIFQFLFDANTGRLTPNSVPHAIPKELEGPRHFCFHPRRNAVYFVNEQGNSVTAYHLDTTAGTLSPFQTISTLPAGYDGVSHTAEIRITPSGRFLYASNRGHDSIACFGVDPDTGSLSSLGQQPTEQTPRAFTFDPEGRFLFAAGQGSGKLATYRIDAGNGKLQPLETYMVGQSPSWVLILNLGG